MSSINNTIQDLKQKYSVLKDCRTNIVSLQDNITVKIQKLNAIYEELIKFNKKTLFVIGLDTFYFQKTLLNIEYETLTTYFNMISNRIYCDYYKMYKIIQKYVIDNINENKILDLFKTFSNYPVYDNLNIHKTYSFENITNIFSDIVDILLSMNEYCNNQHIILKNYKIKQNYGLNINNFVFTFENQVIDLVNKVDLFNKYMHFFVSIHYKYFSKYLTKIKLMFTQINHDIKLDETFNTSKQTSDKLIEELTFQTDNDVSIINQIKNDIISEDSNKNNNTNRLQSINKIKSLQPISSKNNEDIIEQNNIKVSPEISKKNNENILKKDNINIQEINCINNENNSLHITISVPEINETKNKTEQIELNNKSEIISQIKLNTDSISDEKSISESVSCISDEKSNISCISECPNKKHSHDTTLLEDIEHHQEIDNIDNIKNEIKLNINVSSDELEAKINNLENIDKNNKSDIDSVISEQSADIILSEQHQNNISLIVKPKRKYTKRNKVK